MFYSQERNALREHESIMFSGDTVKDIIESQSQAVVSSFSQYGCVLLDCSGSSINPKENLLSLTPLFGHVLRHRSSGQDGIVTITPTDDTVYLGLTYEPFLPHTDGSFLPDPPRVLVLQCVIPSLAGGVSQLIQGELLYQHLANVDSKGLEALFDDDATTITNIDGTSYSHPIFRREKNLVQMAFRVSDMQLTVTPKPIVKNVFDSLLEYINNPSNQLRFKLKSQQIVVVDNTRMLHGRTGIPTDEPQKRKMHRLWLDGKSDLPLQIGFIP